MVYSSLLRLAKRGLKAGGGGHIGAGSQHFICYALDDQEDGDFNRHARIHRLKCIIENRLDNCLSLEGWLYAKHGIDRPPAWMVNDRFRYEDKMQVTRHAWIDSLIKEFEAKGQ
jgi:hypothetical protein